LIFSAGDFDPGRLAVEAEAVVELAKAPVVALDAVADDAGVSRAEGSTWSGAGRGRSGNDAAHSGGAKGG